MLAQGPHGQYAYAGAMQPSPPRSRTGSMNLTPSFSAHKGRGPVPLGLSPSRRHPVPIAPLPGLAPTQLALVRAQPFQPAHPHATPPPAALKHHHGPDDEAMPVGPQLSAKWLQPVVTIVLFLFV